MNVARKGDDWTPLHLAVVFGNVGVVQQLIQAGADVEAVTSEGQTATGLARRYRKTDIADILSRYVKLYSQQYFPKSVKFLKGPFPCKVRSLSLGKVVVLRIDRRW